MLRSDFKKECSSALRVTARHEGVQITIVYLLDCFTSFAMTQSVSKWIVTEAEAIGFDACGIASAKALDEESALVEQWLDEGREGELG